MFRRAAPMIVSRMASSVACPPEKTGRRVQPWIKWFLPMRGRRALLVPTVPIISGVGAIAMSFLTWVCRTCDLALSVST